MNGYIQLACWSNGVTSQAIESLHQRGQKLAQSKRYESAVACYEKVLEHEPHDCLAWYRRGDALAQLKQYEAALQSFDRTIALNPISDEAWIFRGVVLIHLCRYEEALSSCDRAIELQPYLKEAWAFRGAALHRLGQYDAAYKSYAYATGAPCRESLGNRLLRKATRFFQSLLSWVD
jgi:tetratricopeptide (TPR) repeat protein